MSANGESMVRHAAIDRAFHWGTAITMTLLLVTSLLPILGVRFAWYATHWISGLVLTLLIVLHIVRALFWQRPRSMLLLSAADFRSSGAGKYTLAQKLMHLAWATAIVVAVVTGLLMLQKAGVFFMERDPYVRSPGSWGVITLLHDLAERAGAAQPQALAEELLVIVEGTYVTRQLMGTREASFEPARRLLKLTLAAHGIAKPAPERSAHESAVTSASR